MGAVMVSAKTRHHAVKYIMMTSEVSSKHERLEAASTMLDGHLSLAEMPLRKIWYNFVKGRKKSEVSTVYVVEFTDQRFFLVKASYSRQAPQPAISAKITNRGH